MTTPPTEPGAATDRAADRYTPEHSRPSKPSAAVLITDAMIVDPRIDFERGLRYGSPLTIGVIVLLLGIFGWQLASGGLTSSEAIIATGALVRDRVLGGEWWRLLSAAFLHGGPDHIIGNCISLYILGLGCEHAFGARGMVLLFLGCAVGGSLLSIAMSPGPSVGASGAIFGLMSALVVVLHRQRDKIYLRDRRIGIVVAAWAGYTLLLGAMDPVVDNGAHVGGLIAGALLGSIIPTDLRAT